MGTEYLLFHAQFTVPTAIILTLLYYPFLTHRDTYKFTFIIIVAVLYTIPWDSYLIRTGIWSYPPSTVMGYKVFEIPFEEIFFFIIQTYTTSLVYCICTKPLLWPIYLRAASSKRQARDIGTASLVAVWAAGATCILSSSHATYLGLIIIWAVPVLILQWVISHGVILAIPYRGILNAIWIPTIYLWIADSIAIRAGTWTLSSKTKVNLQLWPGLELEEAVFFAVTNALVVFGLVTCDVAFAIDQYDYLTSETLSRNTLSLTSAFKAIARKRTTFNNAILDELCEASKCLYLKSQSMYLGSALFQGQLRIDLIFLYSFCRVIDDLVDETENKDQALLWIERCSELLDTRFHSQNFENSISEKYISCEANRRLIASIKQLPARRLSKQPLLDLLRGFTMDLEFNHKQGSFPIRTEFDLDMYATLVAGTVGELTLNLIYHHYFQNKPIHPPGKLKQIIEAGREMGRALQYVNIARDIHRDAIIGRVYIPTSWLERAGITPSDVIHHPWDTRVYMMQAKLLDKAECCYQTSRAAIDELPAEVRGPVNATIESYMEICRDLRRKKGNLQSGRTFRLALWRRLLVAWKAMNHQKGAGIVKPRKFGYITNRSGWFESW